jgi:hypothetical protein
VPARRPVTSIADAVRFYAANRADIIAVRTIAE